VPARAPRRATPALAIVLAGTCVAAPLWPPHQAAPLAPAALAQPLTPPPPPAPTGTIEIIDEQLEALQGRPVRDVTITGALAADADLVRNQVRVQAGQPLDGPAVRDDVRRLARLGRFEKIEARLQPLQDTSVLVTYALIAAPVIQDVQAAGNREINDGELAAVVGITAGVPANQFLLDGAKRRIVELYQKRGYYQADVQIDTNELAQRGIVVFRIREGDPLKVTTVRFEPTQGVALSLDEGDLLRACVTREWSLLDLSPSAVSSVVQLKFNEPIRTPIGRETRERRAKKGYLDEQDLASDVAALEALLANEGYLRARVDRRVVPSPNGREAAVTFIIDQGPRFVVRSIEVVTDDATPDGSATPPDIIAPAQAAGLIPLKAGAPVTIDSITRSASALRDAYLQLGYVDANVRAMTRQASSPGPEGTPPGADVVLIVTQGRFARTGLVTVKGNDLTQSKVVRRLVTVKPDRPLDGVALRETERKLLESTIFDRSAIRVTPQREDPKNPGYRDVLIEVAETNTGDVGFGASASSDGGVVGQISLTQRNFDIADVPDSFEEFYTGRAFRGAQQTFNLTIAPGSETQTYSIGLSEPYLFETDYSGQVSASFASRVFRRYDEARLGLRAGVGRRFGERWSGSLLFRGEQVEIDNIEPDAATEVFRDAGTNLITSAAIRLSRSALDRPIRPTRGTSLSLGLERVGLLGGDYNFTRLAAEGAAYIPVDEDALGKRTVLLTRTSIVYVPESDDKVPVYERAYLGGRDFRGFRFRGVGPRGVRNDAPSQLTTDSVGGNWSFFVGTQLERPIVDEFVAVVAFVDSGTVTREFSFDDYRVSVGAGLRLYIPPLGPVPLAFDFGFPVRKQETDERRVFSFSLDVPF
jgi:outer membrane protein insertion porin family